MLDYVKDIAAFESQWATAIATAATDTPETVMVTQSTVSRCASPTALPVADFTLQHASN